MSCSVLHFGALAALLITPFASSYHAQELSQTVPQAPSPVRVAPDGTVAITAERVALRTVLEHLRPVCAMAVRLDGTTGARPVSIEVSGLDPIAAVGAVLKVSGLDFAMRARCGSVEHPTLILVRESGGGPPDTTPLALNTEDTRPHAEELPALEPGPAREDERDDRDKPAAVSVAGGSERALAPGELTGKQLIELLTPPPGAKPGVIELPFTDENGHPYLQVAPSGPRRTVTLPFPDANGDPIEVIVPPGPRVPNVAFPVVRPERPAKTTGPSPAPVNPADSRRPGGGGPER